MGIACMFMLGVASCSGVDTNSTKNKIEQPIKYHVIDPHKFQSFVKNWDNNKKPVLFALIRNSDDWGEVFDPAPVMRSNRPFEPDAKLYDQEQIIMVARVTKSSGKGADYQVEGITAKDDELIFRYRFLESKEEPSYFIKAPLMVRIPSHDYKKIIFIENDVTIGTLNGNL